jgi:hypothetical protein
MHSARLLARDIPSDLSWARRKVVVACSDGVVHSSVQ